MSEVTFQETIEEVKDIIEWICGPEMIDYSSIIAISQKLYLIRPKNRKNDSSLKPGGSAIFPWVKNRLIELDLLPKCSGQYAINENFVTAVLHFETWDKEKYGPPYCDLESITGRLKESKSVISKLINSNPIDKIAAKVSRKYRHSCPYCKQYFVNPKALKLHIKESHPIHDIILGD